MQILTVTKARAQLGRWMKRAAGGADIGIIVGGQVVAHVVGAFKRGHGRGVISDAHRPPLQF